MKPRLQPPELLPEDSVAWAEVTFWAEAACFQFGSRLFSSSLHADRRDADNMLNWMAWRHRNTYGAALLIREILEASA